MSSVLTATWKTVVPIFWATLYMYTVLACSVSTSGAIKQSNTRYYYYTVSSTSVAARVQRLQEHSWSTVSACFSFPFPSIPFLPPLFLPSLSSFPFSALSSSLSFHSFLSFFPLLPFPTCPRSPVSTSSQGSVRCSEKDFWNILSSLLLKQT